MFVGSTRRYGVIAAKTDQTAITVSAATYQRFKDDGTAVDEAAEAAQVDGGYVYAFLAAGSTAGDYYVIFQFTVGNETLKIKVLYEVKALTD